MSKKRILILIIPIFLLALPLSSLASEKASEHFNSGISFYDQGNYESALTAFHWAAYEKPDFAEAHYNMGIIYDIQKKFPEAIQAYKRTIQIDPNTNKVMENIVLDSYLVGNFKEAMYYVKLAESLGRPVENSLKDRIWDVYSKDTHGTLVSLGLEKGPSEEIRRQLDSDIVAIEEKLQQKKPSSEDLLELGTKYRQRGDLEKEIQDPQNMN